MLSTKLKEAAGNSADATLYVDDVFSTWLYTGNGSTQTITNGIDLAGKGGMVWLKGRSGTYGTDAHSLSDTARGVGKVLCSNLTQAEFTNSDAWAPSSFNSNGWSISGNYAMNNNATNYASWTFRKAAKFFDVQTVSHTNGTANNIDLSLLGTVGMVIAKITTTTGDWDVWHRSLTAGNNLQLNTTAAQSTTNAWLSVSGTTATLAAAAPTGTYVIYAYAHDTSSTGIIQCGYLDQSVSQTVNLGWEPQFMIMKTVNTSIGPYASWQISDSMRGITASINSSPSLSPTNSDAEDDTAMYFNNPTATGVNIINTNPSAQIVYMAIRRPNKPPTTGTQVFSPIVSSAATGTKLTTNFTVDVQIFAKKSISHNTPAMTRLTGVSSNSTNSGPVLFTNLTVPDTPDNLSLGWDNSGFQICTNFNGANAVYWNFARAPGFFDEVCYTGTGSATTQAHNLGVAPEMMIIKSRSNTGSWWVYDNYLSSPTTKYLRLNEAIPAGAGGGDLWNSTAPTNSVFSVGIAETNYSGYTYVAYLFATLAGIQYINSYVGDGTTGRVINCGFSAGARFICIKATSTTGSWWVWDSARGITSTNDPALQLNSTAAEITSADAIDPSSSGFIVNQEATCSINASGVSYLVWAIA